MLQNNMFSYRIEVHTQQNLENTSACVNRGSAWAITDDIVVTAFHVVCDWSKRWLADVEEDCIYVLCVDGENIELEPVTCDPNCDVALLRRKCRAGADGVIPWKAQAIGEWGAAVGEQWIAPGFATVAGRAIQTLSGTVTNIWPGVSSGELELCVGQGCATSWEGASGSPVCVNNQVVGILITEVSGAATLRAAGVESILRLLRVHEAWELRERCIQLFAIEPKYVLLEIVKKRELKELPESGDSQEIASAIVDHAMRYGTLTILEFLGLLNFSNNVAELKRDILHVATRHERRLWPRASSSFGRMWCHHLGIAPPAQLEEEWKQFIVQEPWHLHVKNLTREFGKVLLDLISNRRESSSELRQLQGNFAGFDVSRAYQTISYDLDRLTVKAVQWLDREKVKPGTLLAERKLQSSLRGKLTCLEHVFKPETPRGRCFLLMGSTGSGKTHFIDWLLANDSRSFETPLILPVTLNNVGTLSGKSVEEAILNALNSATGRCFRSLREFQTTLDDLRSSYETYAVKRAKSIDAISVRTPRLIVVFDELHSAVHRGMQATQLFESLEATIEDATVYPSIYWLVTLRDALYDQIPTRRGSIGAPSFWEQYGVVGSFGERLNGAKSDSCKQSVSAKAGWLDVDSINIENEVGTKILSDWLGGDELTPLLSDISANHRSATFLRYLQSPWFAWFLTSLDKATIKNAMVNGDLHYVAIVERLRNTRFDTLGESEENRREVRRYIRSLTAALVLGDGRRRNDGQLISDVQQHSARLHYQFASDSLKQHISKLLHNNLLILDASPDGYDEYLEIDLDMLWAFEGAYDLCEELKGKDETLIKQYLIDHLHSSASDGVGLKESALEFLVMIADHASPPLVEIVVRLVLTIGILDPAGIVFAAPKVSERLQDLIFQASHGQSLFTKGSIVDRRTLLAWMMFVERASTDAIRPHERLGIMQTAYEEIFINGFSKYYYAVAAKILSEVEDQKTLRDCMVALRGCERAQGNCAKHLADLAVDRLFAIASSVYEDDTTDDIVLLDVINEMFSYLKEGYIYVEQEYETRRNRQHGPEKSAASRTEEKSRWSREFFREWVLLAFCDRVVATMGPSKSFYFLSEHGWYTNKKVHNPVAHEMTREANNSIGRYFHSRESGLDRNDKEGADFLALLTELVDSSNQADRMNAFHLIRHTRPTYGDYDVQINEKLAPLLLSLAKYPEMKRNQNFWKFFKANGGGVER